MTESSASNFSEIVVYIHGVSHEPGSHEPVYRALHHGIAGQLTGQSGDWPSDFVPVEWGWEYPGGTDRSERRLTEAQRLLGGRIEQAMDATTEFTLNPLRIAINKVRPLLIYRFADMFYYVSRDGKEAIRQAVAEQIIAGIEQRVSLSGSDKVSLTLIGHSAGSVIGFDLLFHLFHRDLEHDFFQKPAQTDEAAALRTKLDELRAMAQGGRLRLRRFFTFGSPVAWTVVRKDEVVDILAASDRLDPLNYGLDPNAPGEPLNGPRWVNL